MHKSIEKNGENICPVTDDIPHGTEFEMTNRSWKNLRIFSLLQKLQGDEWNKHKRKAFKNATYEITTRWKTEFLN